MKTTRTSLSPSNSVVGLPLQPSQFLVLLLQMPLQIMQLLLQRRAIKILKPQQQENIRKNKRTQEQLVYLCLNFCTHTQKTKYSPVTFLFQFFPAFCFILFPNAPDLQKPLLQFTPNDFKVGFRRFLNRQKFALRAKSCSPPASQLHQKEEASSISAACWL